MFPESSPKVPRKFPDHKWNIGHWGSKNRTLGSKNRTLHCVRRCGPRRSSEDMKTRRHEENACLSSCLHVFMSSFECCPWPLSSRRLVGRKGWPLHFSMDVLANLLTLLDHGVASMTVYVYVYVYGDVKSCRRQSWGATTPVQYHDFNVVFHRPMHFIAFPTVPRCSPKVPRKFPDHKWNRMQNYALRVVFF